MAAIIYDPVQFFKKLEKMEKAGGKAGVAARQARELIQDMADKNHLDLKQRSKLTLNGEARIENCQKFHLVNGYRLVFVRNGGCFIFLFLGSHDETDAWIKNNSGFRPDFSQGEIVPRSKPYAKHVRNHREDQLDFPHDYDKPLHEFIDQKTLREIFPGISAQPRNELSCR
ncbi:MAG TPA: hypothetical protein ENN39_02085 [Desulfonatronum sp.]|nr:hypothetical protein [Desulfonatronum sp.]